MYQTNKNLNMQFDRLYKLNADKLIRIGCGSFHVFQQHGPKESSSQLSANLLEALILTRDISECSSKSIVVVVDDKRPSALNASSVSHLTLASTESLARIHL